MTSSRADVYRALDTERDYQSEKWDGRYNQPAGYCLYMENYLEEARHIASRTDMSSPAAMQAFLDVMRKVTALGVACMEQHGAPERFIPAAAQVVQE